MLRGHRRAADAGDRPDGVGARPRHARRATSRRTARPTPSSPPGWPSCSPSTTTRCWPRTSTARRRSRTAGSAARSPAQTGRALVHPVFFGSAITGAGVDALVAGIAELLPAAEGDADGPVSGTVFKVERGPAGEKIAYVRLFSGDGAHARPRCTFGRARARRRSPRSACSTGARPSGAPSVAAGQIGKLWGLGDVRIGDAVGAPRAGPDGHHFAPPTLETVVVPAPPGRQGALHVALDPARRAGPADRPAAGRRPAGDCTSRSTARCRRRSSRRRWRTTSASRSSSARRRRSASSGRSAPARPSRSMGEGAEPVPRHRRAARRAGAGRHRRASSGSGRRGARHDAARVLQGGRGDRAPRRCAQGLYGWQVTDCAVTMTHSGYAPRQSHAHQGFAKSMSSTGAGLPQPDAAGR